MEYARLASSVITYFVVRLDPTHRRIGDKQSAILTGTGLAISLNL
ncbi:hypothetical protein [Treponema bryantii]|nr:hypothetical protein [Treponema bryantii]